MQELGESMKRAHFFNQIVKGKYNKEKQMKTTRMNKQIQQHVINLLQKFTYTPTTVTFILLFTFTQQ
eukprot:m.89155 g.89155  ORF g.89155 m.89155 type:complete len:67 (+) comp13207_c0_seq1:1418-1618(+)